MRGLFQWCAERRRPTSRRSGRLCQRVFTLGASAAPEPELALRRDRSPPGCGHRRGPTGAYFRHTGANGDETEPNRGERRGGRAAEESTYVAVKLVACRTTGTRAAGNDPRPELPDVIAERDGITWASVLVTAPALDRYLEQVAAIHVNRGYPVRPLALGRRFGHEGLVPLSPPNRGARTSSCPL